MGCEDHDARHGPAPRAGVDERNRTTVAVPEKHGAFDVQGLDETWENLQRFGVYTLVTSTGSWDTGRAITNTVALVLLGPAVLTTLRRTARRVEISRRSAIVEA